MKRLVCTFQVVKKLRDDLAMDRAVTKVNRYYINIALQCRHNHPPSSIASSSLKMNEPPEVMGVSENYKRTTWTAQNKSDSENDEVNMLPDEVVQKETYQIEDIQFRSIGELQLLFKEKLKRLYTLSESCTNSALLAELLGDMEKIDVSLTNDIGYDPII